MAKCAGTRRSGEPCPTDAPAGKQYCYHHDPERADERSRKASRAATLKHAKIGQEIRDARELVIEVLDATLADQLPYKVRKELQSVVQLVQAYARLTELELATGEKGPAFGPLPVALPDNIRQLIKEWALREQAKAEAQAQDNDADGDEAGLTQLEALAEEAVSITGAKGKDAAALRHALG